MKKKFMVRLLIILLFCVAAWCIVRYFQDQQSTFSGSRVRNPDCYTLDIQMMNQEDWHTLELKEGDTLDVDFEITKGKADLVIGIEGEDSIYTGNTIDKAQFELTVPEDGSYRITVTGKRAVGYIHVYANGAGNQ